MLALAEILGLIVLNAMFHAAFTRWKMSRRATRSKRRAPARTHTQYPHHPSPAVAFFDAVPEHAVQVRPAGIDW